MKHIFRKKQLLHALQLALLILVVFATDANADGSIFQVVKEKVSDTLTELRLIIYIIGGLGLASFTFAAIFGKISFKHLANICFSLFLVAMITPFVRYFGGGEAGLPEIEYGTFLNDNGYNGSYPTQPDVPDPNYNNTPSDPEGNGNGNGGNSNGNGGNSNGNGGNSSGGDVAGNSTSSGSTSGGGASQNGGRGEGIEALDLGDVPTIPTPGVTGPKEGLAGGTTDYGNAGQERANAENKNKSSKERRKDFINDMQRISNGASTIYTMGKNIENVINHSGDRWGGVNSTGGAINAGLGTLNDIEQIMGNISAIGGAFGTDSGRQTDDSLSGVVGAVHEGKDALNDMRSLNGYINNMRNIFGNIFGGRR